MNLKFALRQLNKSPGFTAIAIITLALGIGLSTASFSMANTFLLRNVPYPEPERLVRVFATSADSDQRGHAPANLIELREAAESFSVFALFNFDSYAFGELGEPPERVSVMLATADYFDALEVYPFLGRAFVEGEDQPEATPVVVLTDRSWSRYFAKKPEVIGQRVRLNGEPHTVIGVLPPTFDAPLVWGPIDFILPRVMHPGLRNNRDTPSQAWMHGFGRLKPSVTETSARSELETLTTRLVEQHPEQNAGIGVRVASLGTTGVDNVIRALLWLMTGISLSMLLIACANLASLQVARAFTRTREFAVRAALGGNRRQLLSPLLLESMLLAVAGGLLGLLVALCSNRVFGRLSMVNNEPGFEVPIDGRVIVFAVFTSILSGLVFGLAPAWMASRTSPAEVLKEGSRASTGSRAQQRLKRILIISQLAVALMLVGVAASFGVGSRSFLDRDVGWQMDGLFVGNIVAPYEPYNDPQVSQSLHDSLLNRLEAMPGIAHASLSTHLPLFFFGNVQPLEIEGQPPAQPGQELMAEVSSVSSDYFNVLRIPLKAGVGFPSRFSGNEREIAIVNESFATRFWPGESAIGRRLRNGESDQWIEIVGVAHDIEPPGRLERPATRLQIYRPLSQRLSRYLTITLRSEVAPETLTDEVRHTVAALDATLPVSEAGALSFLFKRYMRNLDLVTINLSVSAGMGLLIAGVGLFGVLSQLTAQRTRDIGVRIALGARSHDILRMVLNEGLRLLVIGLLVGVPGYYLFRGALHVALPEMTLPGLWLLGVTIAILSSAMLLACFLPARKATRITPADALRAD